MPDTAVANAIEVVTKSPLAAVVLELPSEHILAASPSASQLLAPSSDPVVGRSFEDFTADTTSGGLDLLLAGRVNGYETTRILRGDTATGGPLQLWVRAIGEGSRHALAVMSPVQARPETLLPPLADEDPHPLVGSANPDLVVDRVCHSTEEVLGVRPENVIGRSVFRLVRPEDAANLMWVIAQATDTGVGASVRVRVRRADETVLWCQFYVQPLLPPPSFTFAMLGDRDEEQLKAGPGHAERVLWRLGHGMETAAVARDLAAISERSGVALTALTTRELDVVGRLLAGDRVPAMAKAMFLSQSTIRNHLSAVFRKLRVNSQQELLHLLRGNG
jgi:DNA-binding CsgD family transcriptional regulator